MDVEEGVNEVGEEGEEEAVEENVEEGEEHGVEEGRARRVKRYTGTGKGSLKWLLSPFPEWIQWWVSRDNMDNIKGLLCYAMKVLCGVKKGLWCRCRLPCCWPNWPPYPGVHCPAAGLPGLPAGPLMWL